MSGAKKFNIKALKAEINKELQFFRNIFSVVSIPLQTKGADDENADYDMVANKQENSEDNNLKRAVTISELEDKLEKLKSQNTNKFNLKNKLLKKSLNSKLNKKLKKKERLNKTNHKPLQNGSLLLMNKSTTESEQKPNVNAKPIFNQDGKLVFSKFDFANVGQHKDKSSKIQKDPKKVLDNIKKQEETFRSLEEKGQKEKVKELKEKAAWKNILQKAEGQKIKDDPMLLKKSIKKLEQKKKKSKKEWDNRVKSVEQKKDDRQKKRKENIAKKKKEKKGKVIKAAVKRGRVVI